MAGDLIQTPQTRWILGAYESVQRGRIITLVAGVAGTVTPPIFSVFFNVATGLAYQVPAGFTLYITHIKMRTTNGSGNQQLVTGTNNVGSDTLVAPAGQVSLSSDGIARTDIFTNMTANQLVEINTILPVATGLYVYLKASANSTPAIAMMLCHEE